jgi:hypothetical protein
MFNNVLTMLTSNVKENYYEMLDFFIVILFICFFSRTGSYANLISQLTTLSLGWQVMIH